jgi:hypothetical protein
VTDELQVFLCPSGCPPGQCDSDGLGIEGTRECYSCCGTGHRLIFEEDPFQPVLTSDFCKRCRGTGEGGGFSSATCSKCGQSAISRAMWELP